MRTLSTSWPLRAAAELERRRRGETAPETFEAWLWRVSPHLRWDWPHLVLYRQKLEALKAGLIQNLMVFMPPQHGKSTLGTVHFPVYWLSQERSLRVVVGSYGQELASDFGRLSRRLARHAGLPIAEDRQSVSDWQVEGGGRYLSVGVGSGVTGKAADLIIVDDPIKSRQQAESPLYRNRVQDWLHNDIYTRGPQARRLFTLTRWHWDDPVGRILKSETAGDWEVLNLPALAEENDPLGREVGQALCPDRLTQEQLERIRLERGEYVFASLYQQRPAPRGGNTFPRGKVDVVKAAPAGTRWCRAWDKAGSREASAKRTAGVRIGIGPDQLVYVGHAVAGRWEALERESTIKATAQVDGVALPIAVEQEPGSGGKESAQSTVRMLQGYTVTIRPASGDGDKFARADAFASQWQAGNVRLVEGAWNEPYLDEMEMAQPGATLLDYMDASAIAYNYLTLHHAGIGSARVRMG